MKLYELFDLSTGFSITWDDSLNEPQEMHAIAYDRQGREINIDFVPVNNTPLVVDVEFTRGGSHAITGAGDAERVFATVISTINEYLTNYCRPDLLVFSGQAGSRNKLYSSLVSRYARKFGYINLSVSDMSPTAAEICGLYGMYDNTFVLANKDIDLESL